MKQDHRDRPAAKDYRARGESLVTTASADLPARMVQRVVLVRMANGARTALQASKVPRASPDRLDHRDHLEHPDLWVLKENRECPEALVRQVLQVSVVRRDHRANRVFLDQLDQQDHVETVVGQVKLDHLVRQEQGVNQERQALQVRTVLPALEGQRESVAQ